MARFAGTVGFVETVEVRPGVFKEVATEKPYFGSIQNNTLQMDSNDRVNTDPLLDNFASIVGDAYASEKASAIRYVRWMGALWTVERIQIKRPRLILRLGGVWNGAVPTPDGP